ncbi:MAG: hypothetical protein JNN05_11875 [Candidatus Omnitrophica bacterium]|nr:hypothetical protein [Candidatus Omnitrophota bacterium]
MKTYRLNKIVLRVFNNAEKFLNGLTSNTLDAAQNAFVNLHGRIVATFDQTKIADDEFLIVIDALAFDGLMAHIQKFLMLNKTSTQKMDLKAYWDLDRSHQLRAGEYAIEQKAGRMILSPNELASSVSQNEFTQYRLEQGIPLFGIDYKADDFLLNVDEYRFVSYTKGCFLGQEPIAKVHNRSKPTWKLAVQFQDELTPEEQAKMTSKILDPLSLKVMGFVFVKNLF